MNKSDFLLHVTCKVNQPKPMDNCAVILPLPAAVAESTPASKLLQDPAVSQLVTEAVKNRIISDILGMDPYEYRRKVWRSEDVPVMPTWEIGGFALATIEHVTANADGYRHLATVCEMMEVAGER